MLIEYCTFPVLLASAKNCQIEFAEMVFVSEIDPEIFLAEYGTPDAVIGVLPPVVDVVEEEITVFSMM